MTPRLHTEDLPNITTMAKDSNIEDLQSAWKEMFQKTLPAAATSKSSAQVGSSHLESQAAWQLTVYKPKWPVHVDHCFARIILDAAVGIDTPWMSKIKSPAYKNMSREQLEASIKLGHAILDGEADLVELDSQSLELRGKGKGMSGKASGKLPGATNPGKRKRSGDEDTEASRKAPNSSHAPSSTHEAEQTSAPKSPADSKSESASTPDPQNLTPYLKKIALSQKTTFQKKVLTALCQVPRGRYTTYAAIARHLSSSPRAVGNAMRNNPFAPQVPCHRVLASGGGLGGFMGSWGRNGEAGLNDDKKRRLLREEGVSFDGRGRVVGSPWEGFQ